MSQPKLPVPLPRNGRLPVTSANGQQLTSSSSSQSPTKKSPPPVLPKTWTPTNMSGESKTILENIEKMKIVEKQRAAGDCNARPPLLLKVPKKQLGVNNETSDAKLLFYLEKEITHSENLYVDFNNESATEAEIIGTKAECVYDKIQKYTFLMSQHDGSLQQKLLELQSIADNIHKVSKGTKIAGITGGATSVAGGVAAAAGVILCPFTAGASLALTAVGVGAVAVGGVTGASAAITNKACSTLDKKKISTTLKDFYEQYQDILSCQKEISKGVEQLKLHRLPPLNQIKSRRVAAVVKLATEEANAMTSEVSSKAFGIIKGFELGMDFYFTQGKNGQAVKKGLESKFAKKICNLVEELEKGLSELMDLYNLYTEYTKWVSA